MASNNLFDDIHIVTPQWLAGFFDGEGCVCLTRRNKTNNRIELSLVVSFSQKQGSVLGLIGIKYLGGTLSFNDDNHHFYKLSYIGTAAKKILEDMLPYSYVKRDQIVLGLEFIKTMRYDGNEKSDEEKLIRNRIYEDLKLAKGKEVN